jgi:hypothetical protein
LFFKELKSTWGFSQYSFHDFEAVKAWVEAAITTVLFLEHPRAQRLQDRRQSQEQRRWWEAQRLHGLYAAFRQACERQELKYLSERLKTPGGVAKLQRLLAAATPSRIQNLRVIDPSTAQLQKAPAREPAVRWPLHAVKPTPGGAGSLAGASG